MRQIRRSIVFARSMHIRCPAMARHSLMLQFSSTYHKNSVRKPAVDAIQSGHEDAGQCDVACRSLTYTHTSSASRSNSSQCSAFVLTSRCYQSFAPAHAAALSSPANLPSLLVNLCVYHVMRYSIYRHGAAPRCTTCIVLCSGESYMPVVRLVEELLCRRPSQCGVET